MYINTCVRINICIYISIQHVFTYMYLYHIYHVDAMHHYPCQKGICIPWVRLITWCFVWSFLSRLAGGCCLPSLCDFHEISIQHVQLPGKQQNIQLLCKGRISPMRREGPQHGESDSSGTKEQRRVLQKEGGRVRLASTLPQLRTATGIYLAHNCLGTDLGSLTEVTFMQGGTVSQQCRQSTRCRNSSFPLVKGSKYMGKHILIFSLPPGPLVRVSTPVRCGRFLMCLTCPS